jgi:hypothetical protein
LTVPVIMAAGIVEAWFGWCEFFRDAVQAADCTLAIARLIERIRLADIRMATPLGLIGLGCADWLSVGGLECGEQQMGLLDQAKEVVLGESAVKLLRSELAFALVECHPVPLITLAVEDVNRTRLAVVGHHLENQDAFAGLNPTRGNGVAKFEEGGYGLFD